MKFGYAIKRALSFWTSLMSVQVHQASLINNDHLETDVRAADAIKSLQEDTEEKKPEIVIKSSDLTMFMNATHLTRAAAIELIQSTEGNVKEALKRYVMQ